MAQSLSRIYVHLTFSTKWRKPLINNEIKQELHAYLAGALRALGSSALIVNSVDDHVHILYRQSKTTTVAKVVEEIKKGSSHWMKIKLENPLFRWQIGYGAFSVSYHQVDVVQKYIARQEQHHKKVDYKEEIEILMKKYRVDEYDPKYYWDDGPEE